MVALKNAKSEQLKLHLADMGIHDAYHKQFEFPVLLVGQSLLKLTSAEQLNELLNIFHRKTPRANIN